MNEKKFQCLQKNSQNGVYTKSEKQTKKTTTTDNQERERRDRNEKKLVDQV